MSAGVLQVAIDAARSERKLQRVLLSGAEGVGRSRLLANAGALVVDLSRGRLMPQTLRALLGPIDEHEVFNVLSAAPALEGLEPERARTAIELLAALLGTRLNGTRTAKLDEASRREGAALELGRWLIDRASREPLIIAFDDAHLTDDEGVAFIESLSQREEPVPLVIAVAYDALNERLTPAFRARRDAWFSDSNWRRVELKPMPAAELEALLTTRGATAAQATALARHCNGNPGLAMGLWPRFRDGVALSTLPGSLDGLRLQNVRALGDATLRAAAILGALGGVAPVASLAAVDPSVPSSLAAAVTSGLIEVTRDAGLEVYRFTDARLAVSVSPALPEAEAQRARRNAGAWAAEVLEQVSAADFPGLAPLLVPLAAATLDPSLASFWEEAWAAHLGGRAETIRCLERAANAATGVRRLVLLRRVAEVKLFLGLPDEAIATINSVGRVTTTSATTLPAGNAGQILASHSRGLLDRWETLSLDEAMVGLELVKAECLSYLVKKEDTQRAFTELEKKLVKLKGAAVPHLWIRWARNWSWFLCEILGRASDAMRACTLVRQNVKAEVLAADDEAIAFVRAEEIATTSIGDFTRARQLCEEHITLAAQASRLRDECLGWNARAIVHYGMGELLPAKRAFERALELARGTGWLRREAITLHNLTLVLGELNELDQAFANETTYGRLSVLIGNHAGKAEAPLVLAGIELARNRLDAGDALIQQARRVAEANGWDMLVAWSRALMGRLRLLRYKQNGDFLEVTRAKNDLLAAIETFEERNFAWTEELDPAEVVANFALASKWTGHQSAAAAVIARARGRLPKDNLVSQRQLELADALISNRSLPEAIRWFDDNGFARRSAFWRSV